MSTFTANDLPYKKSYIHSLMLRIGCQPVRHKLVNVNSEKQPNGRSLINVYDTQEAIERIEKRIREYKGNNRSCIPRFMEVIEFLRKHKESA